MPGDTPEGKFLLDSVEAHRRSPVSLVGELVAPAPSSTGSRLAGLNDPALKTE